MPLKVFTQGNFVTNSNRLNFNSIAALCGKKTPHSSLMPSLEEIPFEFCGQTFRAELRH